MPAVVPEPDADDRPVNEPTSVALGSNQEATLTWRPAQQVGTIVLPTVAISKRPDSEYVVRIDGETVFGPAPIPPTDIDDLAPTFLPAYELQQELTLIVRSFQQTTGDRTYHVQPVGYEVVE